MKISLQRVTLKKNIIRHHLSLSAGQLLMVKGENAENFKLFSTPLSFQFDQAAAQPFTLQIHKTSEELLVYLSSLDLALISQTSPLFIAPDNIQKLLSELKVSGISHDIFLKKNGRRYFSVG